VSHRKSNSFYMLPVLLSCCVFLVASAVIPLGLLCASDSNDSYEQTLPIKAIDFLSSLGVDTHITQSLDSAGQVISGLQYTGIRNIRDDATHDTALYEEYCNIHSTTGAMVDLLPIVDSDPNNIQDSLVQYEALAACGALLAAEGPNEPDNFPFSYNGQTCGGAAAVTYVSCAAYQSALYTAVHADSKLAGRPVWAQTEPGFEPDNQGLQYLVIPSGTSADQPSGTVYADFANLHNYVEGNGQDSVQDNQAWYAESNGASQGSWDGVDGEFIGTTWREGFTAAALSKGPTLPKVTTETGWPTNGSITQDQQGKLFVNLYLSAMKLNWSRTFIYMMFDEPGQGNYGLFASNASSSSPISPKLSATYIQTLTRILSDTTSEFKPVALDYFVAEEPATVHDLLIQKSNGTYELAVWDDRPVGEGSDEVTVNLGSSFPTVNLYDVTSGSIPIRTLSNVTSVPLTLTDHAIILELEPAPQSLQKGTRSPSLTPGSTSFRAATLAPAVPLTLGPKTSLTSTANETSTSVSGFSISGYYEIGSQLVLSTQYSQAPSPLVETAANPIGSNAYENWSITPVNGSWTICDYDAGQGYAGCLMDDGNSTLDLGYDTWTIAPYGSGYSLQNTRTGHYIGTLPLTAGSTAPLSSTPVAIALTPLTSTDPTPSATPTPAQTAVFKWRAVASVDASGSGTVTFGSTAHGDFLTFFALSVGASGPISCPSGWTAFSCGTRYNGFSPTDYITACYQWWYTGYPTTVSTGSVSYPEAVVRDYSGVTAVDSCQTLPPANGGITSATSEAIPAFHTATISNSETYVGFEASTNALTAGSSGWSDTTLEDVQWGTYDGDFNIASAGTVPAGQSFTQSTGNASLGYAVTLEPGNAPPAPTPTPTPTPTPADSPTATPSPTPSGTNVTVNYASSVGSGSPLVFGVNDMPMNNNALDAAEQNIGMRFVRFDPSLWQTPPTTTTASYQAALSEGCPTGSVCDPSTWDWAASIPQIPEAISLGMKVIAVFAGLPPWDSTTGTMWGMPSNVAVFQDIVKKVYQHYQGYISYVEINNEPDCNGLTQAQYAQFYYYEAQAIRSIDPSVPLGGPVVCSPSNLPGYVSAIQGNSSVPSSWLNFISFHYYANTSAFPTTASGYGLPVFVSEWNADSNCSDTSADQSGPNVTAYAASELIFGLTQAFAGTNYYDAISYDVGSDCDLYVTGSSTGSYTGQLYYESRAFQLLSVSLGLGNGTSTLYSTALTGGPAVGAINSAGQVVAADANWSDSTPTVTFQLSNLPFAGAVNVETYLADAGSNTGASPISNTNMMVSNGSLSIPVTLTAESVAGVVVTP
jgi:hypothetical protein